MALEQDLRHALERNELELYFQPIVSTFGGPIVGLESLLRWHHPKQGFVSPAVFIPVAEESGLILTIGEWALREACKALAMWRRTIPSAANLHVSVNLSARQLQEENIEELVTSVLSETGIPGEALFLELTESLLIANETEALSKLQRLKALGIGLWIDDFGTGYSSLAYLSRYPVDGVKIDRAFVRELEVPNSPEETLVAAIVAMGEALGLRIVAEGVETKAQEERLRALRCAYSQGFLYSRPLPRDQITALLSKDTSPIVLPS
jgi:EAL domain-containing protein (putative c-di-GMP-specific phosphodiesterase class I)